MTVVVDTSVLIDHLRGVPAATQLLADAFDAGERVTGSVLSKVEVLAGMRRAEERATRQLLSLLEWQAADDQVAEVAGQYANTYLASHPGVDTTDYVIAATVTRLGAVLWTHNVRHFPMFAGLKPPY